MLAVRGWLEGLCLTRRHIIIWLDRDVLIDLHIVDVLQDGETVSDTGNAHLL